jgi:hypothetical protein
VKASASNGGSSAYFGPYTLHIGCTTSLVTLADSSSLNTNPRVAVGSSTANAFEFVAPDTGYTWCANTQNEIVNPDATGTPWASDVVLTSSNSPATQFNLLSTS